MMFLNFYIFTWDGVVHDTGALAANDVAAFHVMTSGTKGDDVGAL
jgi:hypothetical protein